MKKWGLVGGVAFLASCATTVYEERLRGVAPPTVAAVPAGQFAALDKALLRSLEYFRRVGAETVFEYGELRYSVAEMIASTELARELIAAGQNDDAVVQAMRAKFHWLKSPGRERDAKVLFTGYFEPQYAGAVAASAQYPIPVLPIPPDLQVLELGAFRSNLENRTIVYRLDGSNTPVPYYTREQIVGGVLADVQPIAYMQSLTDLFFMQVQGSGLLQTDSGEVLRIGYAGANGRPYTSVGRVLIENKTIPAEKMSMQAIRRHLHDNPTDEIDLLNQNQSYVFFQQLPIEEGPFGNINVALTPEASLALDYRLFPAGALAFADTRIPHCAVDCDDSVPLQSFFAVQDTGGAIRGYGKADIFWGKGERAAAIAGHTKHLGDLYILVAKKEYL